LELENLKALEMMPSNEFIANSLWFDACRFTKSRDPKLELENQELRVAVKTLNEEIVSLTKELKKKDKKEEEVKVNDYFNVKPKKEEFCQGYEPKKPKLILPAAVKKEEIEQSDKTEKDEGKMVIYDNNKFKVKVNSHVEGSGGKNALQELCSKQRYGLPSYETVHRGPPHAPYFCTKVKVLAEGNVYEAVSKDCPTKKESELDAARTMISLLAKSLHKEDIVPANNYKNDLQEWLQKRSFPIPCWVAFQDKKGTWGSKLRIHINNDPYEFEVEGHGSIKAAHHESTIKALNFVLTLNM
jgi:dsRNA-specific ribonuclease